MSAAQVVLNEAENPSFITEAVTTPPTEEETVKFDGGLFHPPKKEPIARVTTGLAQVADSPMPTIANEPLTPPLSVWGKAIEDRLAKLEAFARKMTDPDRVRPSLAQPPTQAIATQAVPHPLMEPVIEGGVPARMDEEVIELPNSNRDWNQPYKEYREDGRRSVSR